MFLTVVTFVCVFVTGDGVQQTLFQKERETNITHSSFFVVDVKTRNQCLSKCAATKNCKSIIISAGHPRNYISCSIIILNAEDLKLNNLQIDSSSTVWTLKNSRNQGSQRLITTTTAMTTTTTAIDTSTVSTTDSTSTQQTTELTTAPGPTVQATGPSGLFT